MITLLF